MVRSIARHVTGKRGRWAVIAAWLLVAAAVVPLQPRLQEIAADESDTFEARSAESTRVDELLDTRFPESGWSTSVIVYQAENVMEHTGEITRQMEELCATETLPDLVGVGSSGGITCGDLGHPLGPETPPSSISDDQTTGMVTVINGKDDTASVERDVAAIREIATGPDGEGGLRSWVTGPAAFDADRSEALKGIDGTLLSITMALVVVLLLAIYRSPLVAATPLVVVGAAYLIASAVVLGLVEAGVLTVSGQATAILIVLMYGAGTDYCLLLVARYREELRARGEAAPAMRAALERTAPTILAAGGIVIAAMLVLVVADFRATAEMGPILAIGVATMVAAGLTFLPALLVALGRRAFWPRVPAAGSAPARRSAWERVGELVRSRPRLVALASAGLLALGALGSLEGRETLDFTEIFRDPPESVRGQEVIREKFPPGRVAPLDVVVRSGAAADEVLAALRADDRIAEANASSQTDDQQLISLEASLNVDPFSEEAREQIPGIRELVKEAGGGDDSAVLVGGITAEAYDTNRALASDARLIVPLTLLVVLAILVALLRCVIAPLYAVATVVLSFAFALGASSLVFTHVFGQPGSDPNLATFAFIFLVALGVDYNVFLLGRVREHHRSGMATPDAVVAGLARTGGVITSAGLILAGTFAALMAVELESLFQVGFTVALGVLVDTFLVRTLLVPALAVWLGDRSWWPRRPAPGA